MGLVVEILAPGVTEPLRDAVMSGKRRDGMPRSTARPIAFIAITATYAAFWIVAFWPSIVQAVQSDDYAGKYERRGKRQGVAATRGPVLGWVDAEHRRSRDGQE